MCNVTQSQCPLPCCSCSANQEIRLGLKKPGNNNHHSTSVLVVPQSGNFVPNVLVVFENCYQISSTPTFTIPDFARANPPPDPGRLCSKIPVAMPPESRKRKISPPFRTTKLTPDENFPSRVLVPHHLCRLRENVCLAPARHATFVLTIPTLTSDLPSPR